MKIRKEFIAFGVIVVIILGFLLFSLRGGGRRSYNYDKNGIHITVDPDFVEEGVSEFTSFEDMYAEYAQQMGEAQSVNSVGTESSTPVSTSIPSSSQSSWEQTGDQQVSEPPASEEPVGGSEFEDTDLWDVDGQGTTSTFNYPRALISCICSTDEGMFDSRLTPEVREFLDTHKSDEPYSTLRGVTSFKDVTSDGNRFSFGAGDDTRYVFEYTLEDGKVSSLVYIQ